MSDHPDDTRDDAAAPRRADREAGGRARTGRPTKGRTGLILTLVGLAVGLPLVIGGGVWIWLGLQSKEVVKGERWVVDIEVAATGFFSSLENGDADGVYQAATDHFRTTTSKEGFDTLVKGNRILTQRHAATKTATPSPTGTAPHRRVVISYRVAPPEPDPPPPPRPPPDERGNVPPPPPIPQPLKPPPGGYGPEITCTLTLVEQADGKWKVDGFTVP